jgi:3-methyladenine DNA glycosylase AlkD
VADAANGAGHADRVAGVTGAGVDEIVERVARQLADAADPERAVEAKRYLKSDLAHLGARVPEVRAIVEQALPNRPPVDHDLVVAVAEPLWEEPVHERRLAACQVLEQHEAALTAGDLPLIERLLREARTWALVDVLAPNVVGPMAERDPAGVGPVLDRWNVDRDLWLRRASVLALLRPLRAGGGDWDRFTRYADARWTEEEFFIRKALGWVLRDTARGRPDLVFEWLLPRAASASGVTIREAIKPLDEDQRAAIADARSGRGGRRDAPHGRP